MSRTLRVSLTLLVCIYFWHYAATYTVWHFIDGANLIFHEAGHAIFMFFGQFIHVLMGSGFQTLLPALIAGYFFYHRQKISGAICIMWVGQNLLNVSVYAGDSIVMKLPLLGGDGSFHDWNYLLSTLHVLQYTPQIAAAIYALGMTILVASSVLSLWFAWQEPRQKLPI